jgi:hypothetical protein
MSTALAIPALGEALEEAWAELWIAGETDCPVCREPMVATDSGEGECSYCGSRLS